ncbi:hypothetical protein EP7_003265 [Isosphaeraceae bacterium EP7]
MPVERLARPLELIPAFASTVLHLPTRVRGYRRFAVLAVYLLAIVATWTLLWRWSQLRELPDVGDRAFRVTRTRPPAELNAFGPYLRAIEGLGEVIEAQGGVATSGYVDQNGVDPVMRAWMSQHPGAMELLIEGASRPDAFIDVEGGMTGARATAIRLEATKRLAALADAALMEAGRLRREGDLAGAWAHLIAAIRASRHMAMAEPTARFEASNLAEVAIEPVFEWGRDPKVDLALLRRALDELAAAEALTRPISDVYRAQYATAEESLSNLRPLIHGWSEVRQPAEWPDPLAHTPALESFLNGEPERSRRVLRLLAANDLAWCDRPIFERPEFAEPRLRIYASDPAALAAARALPADDLARWLDSSLIAPTLLWRLGEAELVDRGDRQWMALLKDAVAVPLFTREMGRPPAFSAEAIRHYFPDPAAALDPVEPGPASGRVEEK